jgi:hypothetical protein
MAHNVMKITANPAYSPDLAPYDFYFFGHMKERFRRESVETGEQLLWTVEGFVRSLGKWTLTKGFLEWMKRLERYIETNPD